MITLYGIKQCDTCRKTQRWLDQRDISYDWQDVRESPLSASTINEWLRVVDWSALVNKRSTTWRELDTSARDSLDAQSVVQQFLSTPTLIKRPLLVHDDGIEVGFNEKKYADIFGV